MGEIFSCCEGFRAGGFDVLMFPPSFLLSSSEYYKAWVDGKYTGYTMLQLVLNSPNLSFLSKFPLEEY